MYDTRTAPNWEIDQALENVMVLISASQSLKGMLHNGTKPFPIIDEKLALQMTRSVAT